MKKSFDIESLYEGEGGYVFLSHSHNDIREVREVRNLLEECGFEPILFYLRSLDDLNGKNEQLLKKLIYDEIDAREFFIYLDSENARSSKWVKDEFAHVQNTAPDKVREVNLETDKEAILRQVRRIITRMRIYLSYSRADKALALKIKAGLLAHDYRVYTDEDLRPGADLLNTTLAAIAESGTVLLLLTKSSARSPFVQKELETAYSQRKNIITVYVGDVEPDASLSFIFSQFQILRLPECPTDKDIEGLICILKDAI